MHGLLAAFMAFATLFSASEAASACPIEARGPVVPAP